jgi:hypothetical protein
MPDYKISVEKKTYELKINSVIASSVTSVDGQTGAVVTKAAYATETAKSTISALQAVAAEDGGIVPASASNLSHAGAVAGVAITSGTAGASIRVLTSGIIDDLSWAWTMGAPVFLGANGQLTQTVDMGAEFTQQIGVPAETTRLIIRIQQAIIT